MSVSDGSGQVTNQPQVASQSPTQGEQYGLAVGSLVCGIVAIPGALGIAILGILLAIVAIVLGVIVRRNPSPTPRIATAGLVLGVIALALGVVNSIFGALLFSGRL